VRARWLCALLGAAFSLAPGCGGDDPAGAVGTTRIRLRSTQTLNPSDVNKVIIAVLHDPSKTCVSGSGSNTCVEILGVDEAQKSTGYVMQASITQTSGSSAMLEDLPMGTTCFVAEARSSASKILGLGCAEVELKLEKHVIEIELTEK
jgi:hypothetical protein